MDREDARQYIIDRSTDYLQPDKCKRGYICPICGSGSGSKGTGITTKDKVHFTCWAGCFTNSDIIDIIGQEHGLTDYNDKLQKAADALNITIERGHSRTNARKDFAPAPEHQNQPKIEQRTYSNVHTVDYTDFFLQANRNIQKTTYHRGLSIETLNRFKIGYVESWRNPKAPNAPASPRLIIPTSKESYLARDTRNQIPEEQKPYAKIKVGSIHIFNVMALKNATKPIFVVEGELDALSIIDVGGEAIALGTTTMVRSLLETLRTKKPEQPLIIALDNDSAGEKAATELTEGLERLKIPFYKSNPAGKYKDANEALQSNREAFRQAVEQAERTREEEAREAYLSTSTAHYLQSFIDDITDSVNTPYIPTGFKELDAILDGGLHAGLYVVGAISSLGKTTFCLQIADYVAQCEQDVLIFSLEMARNELIAKSVSRLTLIKDLEEHRTTVHAKTTRGILTGTRYKDYSQTDRKLIQDAIAAYGQYGANIYITEGIGNVGVEEIRDKVQEHIKLTRKAPLVVIDYLQIIAPADIRATDKQNTDKAVLELKRLSRDYSIPVIGISSFNRENYTAPVNLASFKESGAIEYSSDVLIGLQYEGMDYREGEPDGKRQKRVRKLVKDAEQQGRTGQAQSIQVKILKNRNGSKGDALLDFYPMFNYFTDKREVARLSADNGSYTKAKSNYNK